jgi:signal transduction histidine kinase
MGSGSVDRSVHNVLLSVEVKSTLQQTASDILSEYVTELDCLFGAVSVGESLIDSEILVRDSPTEANAMFTSHNFSDILGCVGFDKLRIDREYSTDEFIYSSSELRYYLFPLDSVGYLLLVMDSNGLSDQEVSDLKGVNRRTASACQTAMTMRGEGPSNQINSHQSGSTPPYAGGDSQIPVSENADQTIQDLFEPLIEEIESILTIRDREEVSEFTAESVSRLTGADMAEMLLYDRGEDCLRVVGEASADSIFGKGCIDDPLLWGVYDSEMHHFDNIQVTEASTYDLGGVKSCAVLPVGRHGVLVMGCEQEGVLTESDIQIATLFTTILEITLTRLQRTHSLEVINNLAHDAKSVDTKQELVDLGVNQVMDALDLPFTGIWEYDSITDDLVPVGQTDISRSFVGELPRFSSDDSIAWEVYKSGESRIIDDTTQHQEVDDAVILSEVISPIGDVGVLASGSLREGNITQADRHVVDVLSSTLETSIELVDNRREIALLENVVFRVLRHNIRNDLNVIRGNADLISHKFGDSEFVDAILNKCDQLAQTVDNARMMRTVARENKRGLIDPDLVVEDAHSFLSSSTPEDFDILIDIDCDVDLIAHPKLPIAIGHLLDNSLKHASDSGSQVKLSIDSCGQKANITVTDDGPGIPDEEISVIGEKESVLEHGSGVGLWLVDRIVENSDGELNISTDSGTTVEITLAIAD